MKAEVKILFVGADEFLLKKYSPGHSIEVVSSVNYLNMMSQDYMPDIVFVNTINPEPIRELRQMRRFIYVPIIWIVENFSELNNLNAVADLPRVMLCNRIVALEDDFAFHLQELARKRRSLFPEKTSHFVKYAILFLNKNISRQMTRDLISSQLGVSQDYLTRIFHGEMGISLWEYIEILRMAWAKKLLLETSIPVAEVAVKSGFANCSYFNRNFKNRFGITPGQFRKG